MGKRRATVPLGRLPSIDEETGDVNVVIETPQGSRNKFKFDEELELFVLNKVLPVGAVFPFDFGYIPGTVGEDGDPLDVLLLLDVPVFTGCLVRARLIGVLEAEQSEEGGKKVRNDRLIGVASRSKVYEEVDSVKDVSKNLCGEIEHFFVSYNLQAKRTFKPMGFRGPTTARGLLEEGMGRYAKGKREKE